MFVQVGWRLGSHLKVKLSNVLKFSLFGPLLLHFCMDFKNIWHHCSPYWVKVLLETFVQVSWRSRSHFKFKWSNGMKLSLSKPLLLHLLAHLSYRPKVSYCHQPMSVMSQPSRVVHPASSTTIFALNNISSETIRPRALIFGMKHFLVDLYQVFSNAVPGVLALCWEVLCLKIK